MIGPGIYHDVAAADYHADPCEEPSLSSSIALKLVMKTPAHARGAHPRLTPFAKKKTATKDMELGSVAHEILLGKGGGFEICPFDNYLTKAARAWRDDVIQHGQIPIKEQDLDAAISMADAVRAAVPEIPGAERAIVEGEAETVAIWRDTLGPVCRALIDWLDLAGGAIYDLKTTGTGLSNRSLNAKIAGDDTAYDMRAAFYLRGVEQLVPDAAGRVAYRWIFVESEAPFEVRIFEMDKYVRAFGERKAIFAIAKWQRCLTENLWPGYPRKIEKPEYPAWAEDDWISRELAEDANSEIII